MMNGTMNGGSLMWGMGSGELLTVVLVVFGVAALAIYLSFNKRQ
jgi:threonine/homoserine/homoserine lactone efflux protein